MLSCSECENVFTNKQNLKRHEKFQHNLSNLLCEFCGDNFNNVRNLMHHKLVKHESNCKMEKQNKRPHDSTVTESERKKLKLNKIKLSEEKIKCDICDIEVCKTKLCAHVKTIDHKNKSVTKYYPDENIKIIDTAFKMRIASYRIYETTQIYIEVEEFLEAIKPKVLVLINEQIYSHTAVKVNCEIFALHQKYNAKDDTSATIKSFNSKNIVLTDGSNLHEIYSSIKEALKRKSEDFQAKDSGWALQHILYLELNVNKFSPMRGSSYIDLPDQIKRKHAIINVKNKDEACFAWAVTSALYPAAKNSDRTSSYHHYSEVLNLKDVIFPMSFKEINTFEKLNNLSINVYGLEQNMVVGPLYYTNNKRAKHINLLFLEDGIKSHFCWIKNLSALVSAQISKNGHQISICDGCLVFFRNEDKLKDHIDNDCIKIKSLTPDFDKNILKFKNFKHKLRVPFIIYCDFEAMLKPFHTCSANPENSFTENIQKHEPFSFGYYIKCSYNDEFSKYETYRGTNCANIFIDRIRTDLKWINQKLTTIVPMIPLTENEKLDYEQQKTCFICDGEFSQENYKVREHCHLSGKFTSGVHTKCNLNYKLPDYIPIVCHNLSGYDAHFIIRELGFDNEKINLIAQNKERYISFTKRFKIDEDNAINLRFIDSFKFMATSLDKLSKNLQPSQHKEMSIAFPNENQLNLLTRKGVFPYEYVDSEKRLNDTCLPLKYHFFSKVSNQHISNEEYEYAQKVWNAFECKSLGEYSDLYLKTDVLLLADIFENFRTVCLKTYNLDPAHYYTSPGLSWDAMLKYTNIELELLTDIHMIHFIKNGIRGGLAQCSKKYAKANNKYMVDYDPSKNSTYLSYVDANNLYGYAMSQFLPYANFKWVDSSEIESFDISKISAESDKGYIFEVDLIYPENLHISHSDFPFCFENIIPLYETSTQTKLIASVMNKNNYIIHQTNLKQCLENGLQLKKIHRILEFSQKPWLKSYIDLNTELRKLANNSFEKDFYKLMNNSVFGKTIENVEKRTDVRLITHWENIGKKCGANNLISKPNFHSCSVFTENLVGVQMNRLKIMYNKPIYVGFSVLEISKTIMYDFHYNFIKPLYNDNVSLLYTDTDSFIYEIITDDLYNDIKNNLEHFDTSDYPIDNIYNIPLVNKKVLGKFKDELSGKLLYEFAGLKAKTYCIITESDKINSNKYKETRKIKGVRENVKVTMDEFKICLEQNKKIFKEQVIFKSNKHNLYTQLINKLTLVNSDDKRFVIPNSFETLPWGCKKINDFYFV